MAQSFDSAFDPVRTYAFLNDGGAAARIEATESFWRELMSGAPHSEEAKLVAGGDGWLLSAYDMTASMTTWEMHPAGDEILCVLSGALEAVVQDKGGERVVSLPAGSACCVPKGAWHRLVVRTPGRLLAMTYGKGTEHRPM
jgi:mannose-6-phosphate isomerase-like protein (cupin superfamily)